MRVGFLCTGRVATAVGTARRGPRRGPRLAYPARQGAGTAGGRLAEAAAHGEVVVNATPRTAQ
jgi:hypothetical protein